MSIKATPVLLLTGYLGSGKTTLLNRILANRKGIRFAIIVNDIGEVNIDADLIQRGGIVNSKDDSLIALQNGCICCTLKADLIEQLRDICFQNRFDYIVIEASGICEPEPIARTICSIPTLGVNYTHNGYPVLDCVATVVDALRMQSEFDCGEGLKRFGIEEDDLENLVIQQLEFCNVVLLNKASEVAPSELGRIRSIVRAIQPSAKIIECDWGDVDFDEILNTHLFDYDRTTTSSTWMKEIESPDGEWSREHEDHEDHKEHHDHEGHDDHVEQGHHHEDHKEHERHHHDDEDDGHGEHEHHHDHEDHKDHEEDDEHEGHHHHHHHHEGDGETEEYGIGTYVFMDRRPFDINRFDDFVAKKWPKSIIRAKGICYFSSEPDNCFLFEQAGKQVSLRGIGQWYATMEPEELAQMMEQEPTLREDWDSKYGDRKQKLVFIGQKMDRDAIEKCLRDCIIKD